MTLLVEPNRRRYMQILECMNANTAPRYVVGGRRSEQDRWPPTSHVVPASQRPADLSVTGEQTIEQESPPTTSRARKTWKAMDSVCDALVARCRGDAVEAA
jgi:hypothetical protein